MRNVKGNYINYNGKSSADYDIIVAKNPSLTRANRKYTKVSVPGRNGDLFFLQDAYENYDETYDLFVGDGGDNSTPEAVAKVSEWLDEEVESSTIQDYLNLTIGGYHRLIDSYEPNVIRLAAHIQGFKTNNLRGLFGKPSITFDCRPERFTSDAFTAISKTTSGGYVTNNGRPSKPCLKIYGSGEGTVTCNGYVISISNIPQYIYVDSDSQNCFKDISDANLNNLVTLTSGFPILDNGRNTITWTGGVTQVDVYPRWWNL